MKNLENVEVKLRSQYIVNTNIQEKLSAAEGNVSQLNQQNQVLEKEIVILSEVKKEVVERSTMLTTRQWKKYTQDAKTIWTLYSKIAKAKRTNRVALKYQYELEDLIADYKNDVADISSLSEEQLKSHQVFMDQAEKYRLKLFTG